MFGELLDESAFESGGGLFLGVVEDELGLFGLTLGLFLGGLRFNVLLGFLLFEFSLDQLRVRVEEHLVGLFHELDHLFGNVLDLLVLVE